MPERNEPVYSQNHGHMGNSRWYALELGDGNVEMENFDTGLHFIIPFTQFVRDYHVVNAG